MNSSLTSFNKSISGCIYSNVSLNNDSTTLDQTDRHATSENTSTSAAILARDVIGRIESLKNTKIDCNNMREIKLHFRLLATLCNSKFIHNFPIEIVDIPLFESTYFEIKSWSPTDLNLSNATKFVVYTFEELDRASDDIDCESSTRCVDAILVLIEYFNLVICSRFGYGLWLKPLDALQSASGISNNSSSGEL